MSAMIWILPSMNENMSLWVVPGDEFLNTQSTGTWVISSMTLHVFLYVVPRDESIATQCTMI